LTIDLRKKLPRIVGILLLQNTMTFQASKDAKFFQWHALVIISVCCYGSVEVSTELHKTLSTFPLQQYKCESNNKSCGQLLPHLLAVIQLQYEQHCARCVQHSQHPLTISLVSPVTWRTCYFSPVSSPFKCWISNISTKYY